MKIRRAQLSDRGDIRSVLRDSLRADATDRAPVTGGVLETHYAPWRLNLRLERADTVCVVAERGGEVVGFAEGRVDGDTSRIEWLHVTPQYREEGVGSRMYEQLREELEAAASDE